MPRPALVVIACALSAPALAAPAGRVVRVERPRGKPTGTPRMCMITPGEATAYCVGKRPDVGDVIHVLDTTHVVGTLRIERATPIGSCSTGNEWQVLTKQEAGDVPAFDLDIALYGLVDVELDPKSAHVVDVPHPAGERGPGTHVVGVDTNGDDAPDLQFVQFSCDENGAPAADATSLCVEVWYASGHRFERLRSDRLKSCL